MDALARHRLLLLAGVPLPTMAVPARVEARNEVMGYDEDESDELEVEEDDDESEEEEDVDEEEPDESPAMVRHRQLRMLGIELRARSNPAPGRQVLTPAGSKRFKLPIGATILPNGKVLFGGRTMDRAEATKLYLGENPDAAPAKKAPAKKAPSRTAGITPQEFAARHDEGIRAGLSDADAAKYARSDYDSPRAWKAAHTPAKKAAKAAPAKKATPAAPDLTGARGLSDVPAVRAVQVENRIRAAYAELRAAMREGARQRGWVNLADIREHPMVAGLDRAEVDAALRGFIAERRPGAFLEAEMNQSALTPRDRAAAVRLGGENNHFLRLDDSSLRSLPATPAKAAKKATPRKAPAKAATPEPTTPAVPQSLEAEDTVTIVGRTGRALVDEVRPDGRIVVTFNRHVDRDRRRVDQITVPADRVTLVRKGNRDKDLGDLFVAGHDLGEAERIADQMDRAAIKAAKAPKKLAARPSGLPSDRRPVAADYDDLGVRLIGKSEAEIIEIVEDLNAAELVALARQFPDEAVDSTVFITYTGQRRGLKLPAELSTEDKRRYFAIAISRQSRQVRDGDLQEFMRQRQGSTTPVPAAPVEPTPEPSVDTPEAGPNALTAGGVIAAGRLSRWHRFADALPDDRRRRPPGMSLQMTGLRSDIDSPRSIARRALAAVESGDERAWKNASTELVRELMARLIETKDPRYDKWVADWVAFSGSVQERFDARRPPLTAPTPSSTPAVPALDRQARIDAARGVAEALAEVDELVGDDFPADALQVRLRSRVARGGLTQEQAFQLTAAAQAGDPDRLNAVVDEIATAAGLVRVTGRTGEVEPFQVGTHRNIGGGDARGKMVRILRPGYALPGVERQPFDTGTGPLVIVKADVQEASEEQSAEALARQVRERRGDADLAGAQGLSADPAVREAQIDNRLRAAVTELRSRPYKHIPELNVNVELRNGGDFVYLPELRAELGLDEAEFTAAVRRLNRQPGFVFYDQSERRNLIPKDHQPVRIGGQDKFWLGLDAGAVADLTPRPLPTAAPVESTPEPAENLNAMTVANLRALARERGIRIPSGARKADIIRLLGGTPTTPAQRSRMLALLGVETRADVDPKPGDNNLRNYWVYGEGRKRWNTFTELRRHLLEHVGPERADRIAAEWFHLRYGFWPGDDRNRVRQGKPPRGERVGPG